MAASIYQLVLLCAAAGACGIVETDSPELEISFFAESALVSPLTFRVTVDGYDHDLRLDQGFVGRSDLMTEATREGSLRITTALLSSAGLPLADTTFSQTFLNTYTHFTAGHLGNRRPLGFCISRMYVLPLATGSAGSPDTLFVMTGELPRGAVC